MELIVNDDWKERLARVAAYSDARQCKNGPFCYRCLERELSKDEVDRVEHLFTLVAECTAAMQLNMIKGVLKYGTADRPLGEWLECGLDDAVDTVNYILMARAAQRHRPGQSGEVFGGR